MKRFSIVAMLCGALLAGTYGLSHSSHATAQDSPAVPDGTLELAQHFGWRPLRGFGYYPRPYFRNNYYYGGNYGYPGYYQTYRPFYGGYYYW